jgi:predicted chitinase
MGAFEVFVRHADGDEEVYRRPFVASVDGRRISGRRVDIRFLDEGFRVSRDQMVRVAGAVAGDFAQPITDTLNRFGIDTPLRAAHFISQVAHESAGFRHMVELWGPTPAQVRYEGRTDLGNVQPGDGFRFRGRGLIQLTGRHNYEQFSKAMGVDFTKDPDLVATPKYAALVAGWYWNSRNLNYWADADNAEMVTRRINGGLNGYADRLRYLARAKDALGV